MQDDTVIEKKTSRSGISYSGPYEIHRSKKQIISIICHFIPHSSKPAELSLKIMKQSTPVDEGEISISLNQEAINKLLQYLHANLDISKNNKNGIYIRMPGISEKNNLSSHDRIAEGLSLLKFIEDKDLADYFDDPQIIEEIPEAFKKIMHIKGLQNAIKLLKEMLNNGVTAEADYQAWFDNHSWCMGLSYHPKDNQRTISGSDKVDCLLPNVITGFRDVIELKQPNVEVLLYDKSHRNFYFSAEVSKAIGQCDRYIDVFEEEASKGLRDYPEIVAHLPRGVIIIGRSNDWEESKLKALHRLNRQMTSISIITYDQLAAQGERLLEIITP